MSFVVECWVIILILFIAGYMFVRRGKKIWAGSVLPLMLIPFVYIVVSSHKIRNMLIDTVYVRPLIYTAAFAVFLLWSVLWSKKLSSKKTKISYIICASLFTIALILLLITKGTYL